MDLNDTKSFSPKLTDICPYCGRVLGVNKGFTGWVYFCPRCKDVTNKVNQKFGDSTKSENVSSVSDSEFPQELRRFSWAAFVFNWIWALVRGLWIWGIVMIVAQFLFFLMSVIFLPCVLFIPVCWGLYIWFGFIANRAEWQNNGKYLNAYEFRLSHRRWEIFMKCLLGFMIIIILIGIFAVIFGHTQ